jgi:hypothetical protein
LSIAGRISARGIPLGAWKKVPGIAREQRRVAMRTFVALAAAVLAVVFLGAVVWSAGPTELSESAMRLEKGMKLETVLSILGEPNWAILPGDSGKYSLNQPPDTPEDKKTTFELLWKNGDCSPVSVYFTKYYKVVGWDRGLECGEEAMEALPEEYSCDRSDRSRYCRQ